MLVPLFTSASIATEIRCCVHLCVRVCMHARAHACACSPACVIACACTFVGACVNECRRVCAHALDHARMRVCANKHILKPLCRFWLYWLYQNLIPYSRERKAYFDSAKGEWVHVPMVDFEGPAGSDSQSILERERKRGHRNYTPELWSATIDRNALYPGCNVHHDTRGFGKVVRVFRSSNSWKYSVKFDRLIFSRW